MRLKLVGGEGGEGRGGGLINSHFQKGSAERLKNIRRGERGGRGRGRGLIDSQLRGDLQRS